MSEPSRVSSEDAATEPGIRERMAAARDAILDLLSTRLEIFGEEASQKAYHFARGIACVALAVVTGWITMLLLAALLVTLFTLLFGHAWAGVLATLVVFGGAAAASALFAWRALSSLRPLDFPITGRELRKDWAALMSRWCPRDPSSPLGSARERSSESIDDVEARFRAGSE